MPLEATDGASHDSEAIGRHNQIVFLNEAGKDAGSAKSDESAEIDKKKQRAKRFGLVSVHLLVGTSPQGKGLQSNFACLSLSICQFCNPLQELVI